MTGEKGGSRVARIPTLRKDATDGASALGVQPVFVGGLRRTSNCNCWGEFYFPTHRDETAMNGAPDRLC
ncbi:MAG TPA: hypothetical protein VK578_12345 [Edaphobacter sp.]|nr:hypothetical protein [Edaphobacter sp.]